ncbi:MAG: stage III sporulation protein AF [Lachnospiraceae bacterium]|nr:stage III sporulation protein AF [Lachnospiraceae bacterium]
MNALVELIKKIGIFMIAAQAVIHFAPDIKYAKYMKLIVGIMILLQFLSPVYGIVSGMEADWGEKLSDMEMEFDTYGVSENLTDSYSSLETVEESMEQEIKYRLNNYLTSGDSKENYIVTGVTIELERAGGNNVNTAEYTLKRIRVVVWEHTENAVGSERVSDTDATGDVNSIDKIDKIQVDKINITSDSMEENEDKTTDNLRGRFCSVLGMEEKYMEVVVYGAN